MWANMFLDLPHCCPSRRFGFGEMLHFSLFERFDCEVCYLVIIINDVHNVFQMVHTSQSIGDNQDPVYTVT